MSGLPQPARRSLRLLLAALGGYAFTSGAVALLGAWLPAAGMARTEATTLGSLLAIPIFLAVIVWAVASTAPIRTAIIIIASAAIMIGLSLAAVTG